MLKVARLIRRNRRKHWKRRKVILRQTKEVFFSEKHNINNLKKETPVRKFGIQPVCQFFSFTSVFSNWLYSS